MRPPSAPHSPDLALALALQEEEDRLAAELAAPKPQSHSTREWWSALPRAPVRTMTHEEAWRKQPAPGQRSLWAQVADEAGADARMTLPARVMNEMRSHEAKRTVKGQAASGRVERDEYSTRGGVLDKRTRQTLFKVRGLALRRRSC